MNVFYIPDINGDTVQLDEAESAHAIRVMRLGTGDVLRITDGKGTWYTGVITTAHPKKCVVEITAAEPEQSDRHFSLTLVVAPTKNSDRTEWFVEKATEIGIDRIIPISCRFSERKHLNIQRLEKIAVSAMKQSLKAWLPEIREMISFEQILKLPFGGRKLIAHCYPGEKPHLFHSVRPGEDVLILIGPEGDFSQEEVASALAAGFTEVTLGSARLRTETAALAACHTVVLANQIH